MRLREGASGQAAINTLRTCVSTLQAAGSVPGDDLRLAKEYVSGVSAIARLLRNSFADIPLDRLYNQRFAAINAFEGLRLGELIRDEIERQVAWLDSTRAHLGELILRYAHEAQTLAIVDTHVLLHYRLFNEVDWRRVVDARAVRLIIPLRVIDELDEKKWARRGELGERAQTVIRHLEQHLERNEDVRPGVSLAIVGLGELDPDMYRLPRPAADVEILDVASTLTALASGPVFLVTGDLGMRMRARTRDLPTRPMPDEYREMRVARNPA